MPFMFVYAIVQRGRHYYWTPCSDFSRQVASCSPNHILPVVLMTQKSMQYHVLHSRYARIWTLLSRLKLESYLPPVRRSLLQRLGQKEKILARWGKVAAALMRWKYPAYRWPFPFYCPMNNHSSLPGPSPPFPHRSFYAGKNFPRPRLLAVKINRGTCVSLGRFQAFLPIYTSLAEGRFRLL